MAKLREIASGSATQGLWLGNRKVGSRLISEHRIRLPGKGIVGEARRGGKVPATERKKEYTNLGLDWGER